MRRQGYDYAEIAKTLQTGVQPVPVGNVPIPDLPDQTPEVPGPSSKPTSPEEDYFAQQAGADDFNDDLTDEDRTYLRLKWGEAYKPEEWIKLEQLYEEMTVGRLADTLEKLQKIDLLIIDELSYIKMDRERESLFFQIIRQRYEKSSLIITTNLPMGRWDELFTGQLAATAILDRLLHHCHVLSITGDSYRVKGSKLSVKNGKEQNICQTAK